MSRGSISPGNLDLVEEKEFRNFERRFSVLRFKHCLLSRLATSVEENDGFITNTSTLKDRERERERET